MTLSDERVCWWLRDDAVRKIMQQAIYIHEHF